MGSSLRPVQRPRLIVGASSIQGQGVFATEAIYRGDVILRVDDSRVVDEEHPLKPEEGESAIHRDYLPDGTVTLMRSPECFINHSCQPNSYIYSAVQERFLLAMRDIAAGERNFHGLCTECRGRRRMGMPLRRRHMPRIPQVRLLHAFAGTAARISAIPRSVVCPHTRRPDSTTT